MFRREGHEIGLELRVQFSTSSYPLASHSFNLTLAWLKHNLVFKTFLSLAMVVILCILHGKKKRQPGKRRGRRGKKRVNYVQKIISLISASEHEGEFTRGTRHP